MQNKIPELWEHQKQCIERASGKDCFALFFEVGTGKTRAILEILRDKYNSQGLLKTLIITPLITLRNWQNEFAKFSKVPSGEICLLEGTGKQRLELFTESRAHIFIMNYESLLMPSLYEAIFNWKPDIIIGDEFHRCKDIKSKRTKLAIKLGDIADYRYIMTGTPVLNSPMDLFSQFRFLDGGESLGKNFFVFRNRFFYDANSGMPSQKHFPNWKIKPGALEELNHIIAKCSMSVKKEECLDLPPLVQQTIKVDMTPIQRRSYEEMKKDFITFITTNSTATAAVATLAITKAMRLMQIASGFVKTEDGVEHTFKDTPKEIALKEMLLELTPNHKVIVWAVFNKNYETIRRVCEQCNIPFREATGTVTTKEKFAAVEDFCSDPAIRVFIAHPGSAGEGINLVQASYSIFFSRTFSLGHSIQAEARNHRAGSEIYSKITRYDLVCENSLEEQIQQALADKKKIGEAMLRKIILEE